MLTHPTLDQLRALKLDGMAEAFIELEAQEAARDLAHAEWLALLLDREAANRKHPALPDPAARGPAASRPSRRSRTSTTARRAGSTRRCSSSWPPAAGSPSTAICWSPARAAWASRGCPARWRRRPAATATPSTTRACRACSPISSSPTATAASRGCSASLVKVDLLILDDWGPDRLTASQRRDLMEIVEDRYGRGSTLITSQLPVDTGTTSSASPPSPTPSSIASSTTPTGSSSTARRCASSKPAKRPRPTPQARRAGGADRQAAQGSKEMNAVPSRRPPPWVNRHLPRAPLRQPWGHSAARAGPSC